MAQKKDRGSYGWDDAGNCLWCGEGGRCQCDHSRLVEDTSRYLKAFPYLLEALQEVTKSSRRGEPWNPNAINMAYRAIAQAEGRL